MMGHREMTVDDYISILRRRFWLLVIPAVLLPVIAYGIALVIPPQYTSTTLVLVEQPKVPETIVRSVVTDQLQERLGTMQQQILSRSRLEPIIQRFGLYKSDLGKVAMEDLVGRMRKDIQISLVKSIGGSRPGEVPGFSISFTASDARLAKQVCEEITSMFMKENLVNREEKALGTTEFLRKQVDEAKKRLDEMDQKLSSLKGRYLGQQPGQEQTNLNILMGFTSQLEAATSTLNRAQQDKAYTQTMLDQAISQWQASQAGSNPQTLQQQLVNAQAVLATLEGRYTPDHPDVVTARADVAQIKKKIEESEAEAKKPTIDKEALARLGEPPNIQQLRSTLHLLEQTIREKTREQERLQADIKVYRARVEMSPLVEQQFKEATRDYTTAMEFYDGLLKKLKDSEVSTRLEQQQQSEQFKVWDPANLPEKPSFPNRLYFAGGGLAGGLGLGLAVALLFEFRDKSIRNERDVEAILQLPTLALVPSLAGSSAGNRGLLSLIRKSPPPAQRAEA